MHTSIIQRKQKLELILERNTMFSNQKAPSGGPCYHFKRRNARNEAQATKFNSYQFAIP